MTISAQDVRRLMDAETPDPNLVVQEGRVMVIPAADLQSDQYRGALWVTSRDELAKQIGERDPSDADLDELAAGLDVSVSNLGA